MAVSRAAVFHAAGQPLELREIPIPALQPGQILTRNEFTTLCRSDLNTFAGKRLEPTPTILGHEIVGRIAAFGEAAPRRDLRGAELRVGDRISWAIFASDPLSDLARQGIPQKGSRLFKYGHQQLTEQSVLHGGLSQYTILRPHTPLVKIDASVPLPVAAVINCAVATVAGALRLAGPVQGKNLLVSGAGMLGALACALARCRGAQRIVARDIAPARLQAAPRYGADAVCDSAEPLSQRLPVLLGQAQPLHIVLEFSGVASAMEDTLRALGIGGVAVWVGATYPERPVTLAAEQLVRRLITIRGLHNYNVEDLAAAVDFIEQHHTEFPLASMIEGGFTLDNVNEAFQYGLQANPFRVGIRLD